MRAHPRPLAALAAILLVAAALRLYRLDALSLWNDELFSRFYAQADLVFLWGQGLTMEPNPPLYASILAAWMHLAGQSDAAVRLPSLVASLAAIPLVFATARTIWNNDRPALLATLLLAIAPTDIFYAQEARPYAMQGAAIALALLGLAGFLREPRRTTPLILYAIGAALAVYAHLTSALFVTACNIVVLSALLGRGAPLSSRAIPRWTAANALAVLLCAPLFPMLGAAHAARAIAWMAPLDVWDLPYCLATLAAGPAFMTSFKPTSLGCALILAAIIALRRWRPTRLAATVTLAVPLLSLTLMTAASTIQPMLMLRTVAWLWIPLSLALAGILTASTARRSSPALTGLVLACLTFALVNQWTTTENLKENWRGMLEVLEPRLGPPALILLAPGMPATAFAAYAPGIGPLYQLPNDALPSIETTFIPALLHVRPLAPGALHQAIATNQPVWLFTRDANDPATKILLATLPPPAERTDHGTITAFRW